MRNHILILFVMFFLLSCDQKTKTYSSDPALDSAMAAEAKLDELINSNINKQPFVDSVILGFSFNMTEKETQKQLQKLVQNGKLKLFEDVDFYQFPMNLENAKARAAIAPQYFNGKLYCLNLVISPADDINSDEIVYLYAAMTYIDKYTGYASVQEPDPLDSQKKSYHWFKNNLHIYLHRTVEGTVVSYINMPAKKLLDAAEERDKQASKDSTNKDI